MEAGAVKNAAAALEKANVAYRIEEALKEHTTFCIGGPAAVFCVPETLAQLVRALEIAKENGLRFCLLGMGSNVLFGDEGYCGMVVRLGKGFADIKIAGAHIVAGAAAPLQQVCEAAKNAQLAGLEFAYGIPGSVGGAVYMDAGAFGSEVREVLHTVTFLDENLQQVTLPAHELELGYRSSIFQKKQWYILSATFKLYEGDKDTIGRLMEEHMTHRRAMQPLDMPSAGSAFKRPKGAFAGALIDQSGLRGYQVGGAAISEKHCGFIVNLGEATCRDVLALADHVVETVRQKTGYELEKEIRVVR